MRPPRHRDSPTPSSSGSVGASIAFAGLLFALLVAASYPVASATALGGATAALALDRVVRRIHSGDASCYAPFDVCIEPPSRQSH